MKGAVDPRVSVDEVQEIFFPRPQEGELPGHGLSGADLPVAMEFLDLPPLRGSEFLEDRLGDIPLRDGPIEVREDGPFHPLIRLPCPLRGRRPS